MNKKLIISKTMKMTFGNLKAWALASMALFLGTSFVSCVDDVPQENRFTFKGELIATYLENNPDRFSSFTEILSKAKIGKKSSGSVLKTLSTYGSYTCFAPTNEAVDKYLQAEYDKYIESVEMNKQDPSYPIYRTGIHSPYLEDLTDSMATVIAKNHIIEMGYMTTDVSAGAFPMSTMNRRSTLIDFYTDSTGRVFPLLNNSAKIIEQDLEKENGYVQVIDAVLSPSDRNTGELLEQHASFSLMSGALKATGLDSMLNVYEIDPNYDNTLYGPSFETQNKQQPPYPVEHKQKYTFLVETNDLLADPTKNHLGISIQSIEDIEKFASAWYGTEALGDYKNPKNPVYKFIAYHIVDRKLLYSSSSGSGGFIMENYNHKDFNSEVNLPTAFDRYDYFETKLPYTMIKVTKPFANESEYIPYGTDETTNFKQQIVINYAQDNGTRCNNPNMKYHLNIVVEDATTSKRRPGLEDEFNQESINGIIHTIDKILIYNEDEMVGNVLKERMRWDIMSIFPELTNNGVRWAQQDQYTLTYIPDDFCTRLRVNNSDTHVYYLRPHATGLGGYVNYMGDELLVTGKYDFEYRLPYVPSGNYEIRFGFSQSDARGVAQFYLDGNICGIPVDMRNTTDNQVTIGWFDEDGMSEDEIRENDKAMRNRGFMKAPASCHMTKEKESMRESVLAIRKIIGTYRLDPGDHWLRFKDVMENSTGKLNEFNQDYLEIVPTSVINDPTKPEDIY